MSQVQPRKYNREQVLFCLCIDPLIPSAFEEIKEQENSRFRSLEERFDEMQSKMEKLIEGLGKITDQRELNTVAQSLFSSGLLKTAVSMPSSIETGNHSQSFHLALI